MIETQKDNEKMEHLTIEKGNDKLLELIDNTIDMKVIKETISNDSTQLIFPLCGKRCFNKIAHHIKSLVRMIVNMQLYQVGRPMGIQQPNHLLLF